MAIYREFSPMIDLSHCTSQSNSAAIAASGMLIPRSDRQGMWNSPGKVTSHPEFVYLTDSDLSIDYYGMRLALIDQSDSYSVINVSLPDTDKLYPDENYIALGYTGNFKGILSEDMKTAQSKIMSNKHLWKDCLKKLGVCAHRGPVADIRQIDHKSVMDNRFRFLIEDNRDITTFDQRIYAVNHICSRFGVLRSQIQDMKYNLIERGRLAHVYLGNKLLANVTGPLVC